MKDPRILMILALLNVPFILIQANNIATGHFPFGILAHLGLFTISVFACGFCSATAYALNVYNRKDG
jgi:hypothetical protein